MSKRKKPSRAVRRDLARSPEQDAADFLLGGKSELEPPTEVAPSDGAPGAKMGRPPLKKRVKRGELGLWFEDWRGIERLALEWSDETASDSTVKVTQVVRSVMSQMMPLLQNLPEAPRDE
ncbi:MAG: hypothetical protein AAGI01_17330, partial [Myxococcota bacterium]